MALRRRWKVLGLAFALVVLGVGGACYWMIHIPGDPYEGALPPLTSAESALAAELERDVSALAALGERNDQAPTGLDAARAHVEAALRDAGHMPRTTAFGHGGRRFHNVDAELAGGTRPDELVVIGAHYDTARGAPGANDNASGVAAMLALARRLAGDARLARTIRFVAFANEEPPHFQEPSMGSLHYARRCANEGLDVVAMLSLETMGYYDDAPGSQEYPAPLSFFYPDTGNFIGFVSDTGSRSLLHFTMLSFRAHARFPSHGGALPGSLPGIDWSDHWSFWRAGYPAIMITDTAPFRYPHYHTPEDTADKLDYERLARVVSGVRGVVEDLASTRERW